MAYTELVRLLQIWLAWSLAFFFCIAAPAQAMSASKALANPLATKLDTHYFPINNTDPSGLFPYGETVPGEGAFGDLSGEPLESFKQENDMRRWPQSKWFTTNAETTMTWDQFKTSQSPSLLSEAQAVADEFFGAIKSNKGGVRDAVIAELKAITGPGSISVGDLQGRGIHSEESFGSINPFLNLKSGQGTKGASSFAARRAAAQSKTLLPPARKRGF
jgi:hypothetical protein